MSMVQENSNETSNETAPHFQLLPIICRRQTSPKYVFMRCRLYIGPMALKYNNGKVFFVLPVQGSADSYLPPTHFLVLLKIA